MGMKLPPDVERKVLDLAGVRDAAPLADTISEKDFQAAVIAEAERDGWVTYHVYFSQRSKPGFFDLWLAKHVILHVELKSENGELTAEQCRYRDACIAAGGKYLLWRPSMWPQIVNVLRGCD